MMISLRMALRYLAGRKLRTALTTLAIVLGVAVIFGGNLALPSMIDAYMSMTRSAAGAADLTVTSRAGTTFEPEAPLAQVLSVDGVAAASGLLQRQLTLPAGALGAAPTQITLMGVDPATIMSVHPYRVETGRFLQPGDRRAVVVSADAAATASAAPGGEIRLVTAEGLQPYTVVGVLAGGGLPGTPQLIVTLADAQAILGQPGQIDTIELALRPGADPATVAAAVGSALGGHFVAGTEAADNSTVATFGVAYAMFNVLGVLALFMGGFLIFNTFRTVVLERRRDLGMLRALGAERRQVTRMLLIESLVQGVIGTALGLLAGYGFAALMVAGMNAVAPEFMPGLRVALAFNWTAALQATGFGLLTTLLAGYLPARAAGRVSPLEALRPVAPAGLRQAQRWSLIAGGTLLLIATALLMSGPSTTAAGALLFLIGLAAGAPGLVMPAARLFSPLLTLWFAGEGQVAEGNMTRQPGRAAITASTLMVGLAVLVMTTALVSSMVGYVADVFNRAFSSDILLVPQSVGAYDANVGADERLRQRLEEIEGVGVVGSVRPAMTRAGDRPLAVLGIDPVAYPQVSPLTFAAGSDETAYAELARGRAAIANPILAANLGLKVGDEITLQTAEGEQPYRIAAIGSDALNFKISTLFISQANVAADFKRKDDVMLMLKLAPGADLQATRDAVASVTADYPQFNVWVTAEYRDRLLRESTTYVRGLFYMVGLIILVPAVLGLLNTLTINVLERTREIGMVRAVGGSRRQIRRMVTAEALLLGLFGAATGVLAGVAMSYGFVHALGGTTGWGLSFVFPLLGVGSAVVLGILLALFASVLPARNAARLDIIRALQYE